MHFKQIHSYFAKHKKSTTFTSDALQKLILNLKFNTMKKHYCIVVYRDIGV